MLQERKGEAELQKDKLWVEAKFLIVAPGARTAQYIGRDANLGLCSVFLAFAYRLYHDVAYY